MHTSVTPAMAPTMAKEEAMRQLLRYGIAPNEALSERLMAAADRMAANLARLPQDLPAAVEPAAAFAVPRP